MSEVLGFSAEKMAACERAFRDLAIGLRDHLTSTEHTLRRAYFGAEDNALGIPPEAGYYVGLRLVQSLAAERPLDELVRLPPDEVLALLPGALTRLAASAP